MKGKDVIKFLDSKKTYKKVKKVLSERGRLSTIELGTSFSLDVIDGFIAGGSVSNILFSILYGGEPLINDIDVFHYNNKNNEYEWVSSDNPEFPKPLDTDIFDQIDGYGNSFIRPNGDFAIMQSHKREGILNHIQVHVGSHNKNHDKNLILLNSFDINSCQSGIDLVNGKIVYTENFVEFLRSKQMLVTVAINPIQTVMRLHRKMSDLKCYCDIETEINILKYACFSNGVSLTFGEETYEKYLKDKKIVDKHFIIKKYDDSLSNILAFESIKKYGGELWYFEPKLEKYGINHQFNHPLSLMTYFRLNGNDVSKKKQKKYSILLNSIYDTGITKERPLHRNSEYQVFETKLNIPDIYRQQKSDIVNKFKDVIVHDIYHHCWTTLLINKGYCDCDFDESHIKYINDFIREHPNLGRVLRIFDKLTIQSHYNLLRSIKSISNKYGEWVIGELETLNNNQMYELSKSNDYVKWISEYVEEKHEELCKPLTTPLDISDFEFKDNVRELLSVGELRSEGHRMGHCVGGYGNRIGSGNCRIFTIECDGISSTIEIGTSNKQGNDWRPYSTNKLKYMYDQEFINGASNEDKLKLQRIITDIELGGFSKKQHYGKYPLVKGNATPTEKNQEIAKSLIDYLKFKYRKDDLVDLLYEKHLIEERIYENMLGKKVNHRPHIEDIW